MNLPEVTREVTLGAPGVKATPRNLEIPAGLPYNEYLAVGPNLVQLFTAVRWWLGDWLAYGLKTYGPHVKEVQEWRQGEQQLTMDAVWVSNAVAPERRHPELPWVAHREVAELEDDKQSEWLAKMEKDGMAVVELRRAIRHAGAVNPVKGNSFVWDSPTKKLREVIRWLKARPPEFWTNENMTLWAEEIRPLVDFYEGMVE